MSLRFFATLHAGEGDTGHVYGAGGAPFEPTHWSVVLLLAAQSQSVEAAQVGSGRISARAYWPPLYAFVRRRGYPSCRGAGLRAGFFRPSAGGQYTLSRACREKGHLRTFLLGALQHFMAKDYRSAQTLKRGGGRQIVSLDDCFLEAEAAVSANPVPDETAWYDQTWAAALTRRAWTRLRDAFVEDGKGELFDQLKVFLSGGLAAMPSQEETAARLGFPLATLRTHLHRLRQRYRECLRAEVALTVSSPSQVDEEMHYLYRVLTS